VVAIIEWFVVMFRFAWFYGFLLCFVNCSCYRILHTLCSWGKSF